MGIYTFIKVAEGTGKAIKVARVLIRTGQVAVMLQNVADAYRAHKNKDKEG